MLEQTRRRVSLAVAEQHTLTVVNRAHERFYQKSLADVPPARVVVQPEARGTAAAIGYALLRAATSMPTASVAIFPSDHYVDKTALSCAMLTSRLTRSNNGPRSLCFWV